MRTIMARTPHDSSLSSKRHHLQWTTKTAPTAGDDPHTSLQADQDADEVVDAAPPPAASGGQEGRTTAAPKKKKVPGAAVSRFRAAFMAAIAAGRLHRSVGAGGAGGAGGGLGSRVTGTLFGRRRGHVNFAFQADPRACPALLIELATPTSGLVREMASGLVRIALECEKRQQGDGGRRRLLEEPLWRTYCNGRKCGYAVRRACGAGDWRVLRAVEPVSMGAGVLPAAPGEGEEEGEMMYMRARFERVVGSRDSEAFYMMSPDGNGGPELSIYLLRV